MFRHAEQELFEQAPFDESVPFAWAITPVKVRQLIAKMGSASPMERPSALALVDLFRELTPGAGGGSRGAGVSSVCAIA